VLEIRVNRNPSTAGHDDHVVAFYADDRELTETAGEYLRGALGSGGTAVVLATPAHRLGLQAWMELAGVDVAAARAGGSYVELDAAGTLDQFMINGWPDPAAFWQVINPVIQHTSETATPVRAFGEMVMLLWESGRIEAAIEVEALWNEMASRYSFGLLCGYPAEALSDPELSDALTQVLQAHVGAAGVVPDVGAAGVVPGVVAAGAVLGVAAAGVVPDLGVAGVLPDVGVAGVVPDFGAAGVVPDVGAADAPPDLGQAPLAG
jgi:hypothetical protein